MRRIAGSFDRKWLVTTGVATLAVLGATHIPQEMMPKALSVHMLDKVEHVTAYGTVAFFLLMSFRRPPGLKVTAAILLAAALMGAIDEVTQPLVHRTASSADWAADLVGVAIACGVYLFIRFYRREHLLRSVLQT
jgi:VanZ family protein